MNWSVILVSPKGDGNVGGVARVMGNFGFRDLRIVEPRCDLESLLCKQMSMMSYDIIQSARIFPTLAEAQADRKLSLALSGRKHDDGRPKLGLYEYVQTSLREIHADEPVALVFGREEWGLRLEELDQCDRVIEIPTTSDRPSINLASAVAITLSFLHESKKTIDTEQKELLRPAKKDEEVFFHRMHRILEEIQFANPQNPRQNLADLRAMYHRADLSERDLRILFGVLAGIESKILPK